MSDTCLAQATKLHRTIKTKVLEEVEIVQWRDRLWWATFSYLQLDWARRIKALPPFLDFNGPCATICAVEPEELVVACGGHAAAEG